MHSLQREALYQWAKNSSKKALDVAKSDEQIHNRVEELSRFLPFLVQKRYRQTFNDIKSFIHTKKRLKSFFIYLENSIFSRKLLNFHTWKQICSQRASENTRSSYSVLERTLNNNLKFAFNAMRDISNLKTQTSFNILEKMQRMTNYNKSFAFEKWSQYCKQRRALSLYKAAEKIFSIALGSLSLETTTLFKFKEEENKKATMFKYFVKTTH